MLLSQSYLRQGEQHQGAATGGNGTASADKATAVNGDEITLTATPKEGYAFKEWQVYKGNVEIKDNKFIMPDEDVEV